MIALVLQSAPKKEISQLRNARESAARGQIGMPGLSNEFERENKLFLSAQHQALSFDMSSL